MKILKKILLGIALFIAFLLVVALFVKKDYTIERDITIQKPKQEVYDYVKLMKNQDNYNTWIQADPNIKIGYTGTDGTVGSTKSWDSEKVGKGIQEIKTLVEGDKIGSQIQFIKPFEGIATTEMTTTSLSPTETKVTWSMAGRSPYPMNIMNLFMGTTLGNDLGKSLATLKTILEKK